MKICAISDIHGNLPIIPECDVLCICGDIVPCYMQRNHLECVSWLAGPFQEWALGLPCKKVIMIWGNHDFIGERLYKYGTKELSEDPNWIIGMHGDSQKRLLFQNDVDDKIVILCDTLYEYDGVKFYGTSWCPNLRSWAFYQDECELTEKFSKIPYSTDILLTHCPPKFGQQGIVLDTIYNYGNDYGCEELQDALINIMSNKSTTTYVLGGHIHSGNHNVEKCGNIKYRNVSILDENYEVSYSPFIFDIVC